MAASLFITAPARVRHLREISRPDTNSCILFTYWKERENENKCGTRRFH